MPGKQRDKKPGAKVARVKLTARVTLDAYDAIAEGPGEPCGSGRSWTQPSRMADIRLLMPNDRESRSGSSPDCEPFTTIDDLLHKAQELFVGLRRLSGYKYPLDIRRGVRKGMKKRMNDDRQSRQIKGSGRTYFLDIEETKGGKPYLRITESRKGEGDKFERNSVNVFPEDADEFAQAVSEMASKLE
jgi:hypothetical protein